MLEYESVDKIQPLRDRVLVKQDKTPEKTKGGIIIPEMVPLRKKKQYDKGTIVRIGTGKESKSGKRIPSSLKVGDRIAYSPHVGVEIRIKGSDDIYKLFEEKFIYYEITGEKEED